MALVFFSTSPRPPSDSWKNFVVILLQVHFGQHLVELEFIERQFERLDDLDRQQILRAIRTRMSGRRQRWFLVSLSSMSSIQ
jgi:hypothetical protein